MTASLARDGQGGMTDVLPLNVAGFTYTNDTNTGMRRTGADAQAIKCGGSDIVSVTTSGATVTGDFEASGTIKQNGSAILPIGLGPLPWSGINPPPLFILAGRTYSRTTYAALWAFAQSEIASGNVFYTNGDGATTFGVGLTIPGRAVVCNDSINGTPVGTLTQAVFGSNPAIIGNVGGVQTIAVAKANLPNSTLTVTGTFSGGTSFNPLIGSGSGAPADAGPGQSGNPLAMTVAGTISGTTSALGSGTPLAILQPSIITNYIIFAGV